MPDATNVRIVRVAPEETEPFGALFDEVWPEGAPHAADVEWAFRRRHGADAVILGVFEDLGAGRKLVGARGSLPWPLVTGGRPLGACQFHGTCVAPAYRRRGLFSLANRAFLEAFAAEGGEAIFNVSVRASREGYEKLGWTYLPGLRRFLRFPRPGKVLKVALTTRGELRGRAAPARPRPWSGEQPDWSAVEPFLGNREAALGTAIHTKYDRAFFGWRFSGAHVQYGWVGGAEQGYCVYRSFQRRGLREVLLGDLWPKDWTRKNVEALVQEVVEREEPEVVSVVLSAGHPLRRILARLRWLPDPGGDLNLGVRPLREDAREILNGERWAISMADVDTF